MDYDPLQSEGLCRGRGEKKIIWKHVNPRTLMDLAS